MLIEIATEVLEKGRAAQAAANVATPGDISGGGGGGGDQRGSMQVYAEGELVVYRGGGEPLRIVSVHRDDVEPYYTVRLGLL